MEQIQIEGIAMSDYELVSLFAEYNGQLQTTLMNYVAVLFAFLIAGYLAADNLELRMVSIIVGLFTLVALPQVINAMGFGHDVAALASQIAVRAAEGSSDVGWHGTTTWLGSTGVPVFRATTIIVIVPSYIGALIFFFHQRHVGRAQ